MNSAILQVPPPLLSRPTLNKGMTILEEPITQEEEKELVFYCRTFGYTHTRTCMHMTAYIHVHVHTYGHDIAKMIQTNCSATSCNC